MEHYSSIKKNAILLFAATWKEMKVMIFSEINHMQKDKHHMFLLVREQNSISLKRILVTGNCKGQEGDRAGRS